MGVIDFHVHYNGNIAEAERFASAWRAGGITKAVVFALNHEDGSHTSLDEVAALADRDRDFYVPFGYVNPGHGDGPAAVRDAARRGFKGVKFMYPAKPYDDDEYFPIYEQAARAGMVCLFHTGIVIGNAHQGGLHGVRFQQHWRVSSNYMRPMHLDRIARSFPDMPIVGAHLGTGSWYEEAASMLHWVRNIYFDMSIGQCHYVRKGTPDGQEGRVINPRIRELYDTGALDLNRILFGTDTVVGDPGANPGWALGTLRFEMDGLGATQAEQEAVRWSTAARLLGLPPG